MVRDVILSMSVLVSAGAASAQVHVGAGSQSCGQWVEARRDKSAKDALRRSMMVSWVQGYLVAFAEATADERSADEIADQVMAGKISPLLPNEQITPLRQKMFGTISGWAFDPPDAAAVQVWMDKHCSANPLDSVMVAAGALADELLGERPTAAPTKAPRK